MPYGQYRVSAALEGVVADVVGCLLTECWICIGIGQPYTSEEEGPLLRPRGPIVVYAYFDDCSFLARDWFRNGHVAQFWPMRCKKSPGVRTCEKLSSPFKRGRRKGIGP